MWLICNQPARSVAFLHKKLNTLCRVLIEFVEFRSAQMQKKQNIKRKIHNLHKFGRISAQFTKNDVRKVFKRAFDKFYLPPVANATFINSNLSQRIYL